MSGSGDVPQELDRRLRSFCDLRVADVRESAGRHEYDGVVQDLSPAAVRAGVEDLDMAWFDDPPPKDAFDEKLLDHGATALRLVLGMLEDHRRNPVHHLANLDLAGYDRDYAPVEERMRARQRHLAAWPDAVDAAVEALDRVPAPTARALLPALRGLTEGVTDVRALRAAGRLIEHVGGFSRSGDESAAYDGEELLMLLWAEDAIVFDLGPLAERADAERNRLRELLVDACRRLDANRTPAELVPELLRDHPQTPEEIYAEARALIGEATAFTVERGLLAEPGGECLVGPAPPSRRWAMAMMSWSAAYEPDGPSWYHVTPPDPSWSDEAREEWLSVFSRTTLPAITVHEVTPGHYAHGRALRRLTSHARRLVASSGFIEGWAHYAEELFVEEGFRAADPRYAIGVYVEALIRVTRLAVSLGVHTGAMTVQEGARRFEADAFQRGPAAVAEAERATFDPTYGRYTLGKLEILGARDRARAAWGSGYSHRRFHEALLAAGAPPLGLLDEAVARG
ncbi:MAG TPA: DUF885 family protein [Frankiaceae bacterium]|nr:DUF885 family protein [Frankiaceae bacterium]